MRLVQFLSSDGERRVGLVEEDGAVLRVLRDVSRVYDLALEAERQGFNLESIVALHLGDLRYRLSPGCDPAPTTDCLCIGGQLN